MCVITMSVTLLNVDTQCTSIVFNLLGEDGDSEKACADSEVMLLGW